MSNQKFKNIEIKQREKLINFSESEKIGLHIVISKEQKKKLKLIALKQNMTMNGIIENLINDYISKNENL